MHSSVFPLVVLFESFLLAEDILGGGDASISLTATVYYDTNLDFYMIVAVGNGSDMDFDPIRF